MTITFRLLSLVWLGVGFLCMRDNEIREAIFCAACAVLFAVFEAIEHIKEQK